MRIEDLRKKLAEYALTRDATMKDEWYCTPRALAEGQVGRFLDWLKSDSLDGGLSNAESIDRLALELSHIGIKVPPRDTAFFQAAVSKWLASTVDGGKEHG